MGAALDPLSASSPPVASLCGWTPVHVAATMPRIDWAVFAQPLLQPFFEQDAELAMRRPFNQLFARRTSLDVLDALADAPGVREPAGIIVHVSRCGSTLAAQMLAQLPSLVVLSEAQPFDGVLRRRGNPALDDARLARLLRGLVRAFDPGDGRRILIKLHAWHALHLDLLRRAFPSAPYVVMFREPRAVLRSQHDRIGAELMPGAIPPALLGTDPAELAAPDYGARVVAAFCEAALRHAAGARSLFVDYADLPGAVLERMSPFLGVVPSAQEREAMRAVAALHTKRSLEGVGVKGVASLVADERAVPDELDAQARRRLDEPYAALRALARS